MGTPARIGRALLATLAILGMAAAGVWAGITIATGADPLELLLVAREVAQPQSQPTRTTTSAAATEEPTAAPQATPSTPEPTPSPCGAETSITDSSTAVDLIQDRVTPYLEDLGLCDTELRIEIVDGETVNQAVAARSQDGQLIVPTESLSVPALGYTICLRLGRAFIGAQIFVAAGDPAWASWRDQSGQPVFLGRGLHPSAVLLHELYHAHECDTGKATSEEAADAYAVVNLEEIAASPPIIFQQGLVPPTVPPASAEARAYWAAASPVLEQYLAFIQDWNTWWAQESAQIEGDVAQPGYWDWLCGQMWGWDRLNGIRDGILALSPPSEFSAFHTAFLAAVDAEIEADQHKGVICQGNPTAGYIVNVDAWNAWMGAVDNARDLAGQLQGLVPLGTGSA